MIGDSGKPEIPYRIIIKHKDTFPERLFQFKFLKMKKLSMEIVNPHAAGIDVGSRFHMVAVNQNLQDVKRFGVYTEDHQLLIKWFKDQGVTTIAMESTGSYWQTLFNALQESNFEVILVNGQHTKNIKGRKTDTQDCMWIQKLHSLGLLNGSFLPDYFTDQLRTYYNHRQHLIGQMSKYTNKLQKAFRLMNIRLDVVLNDITGKSGRAITEAIINGQRDCKILADLVDRRVKKSKAEIAQSLQGNWREDLLFEIKECLSLYDIYHSKLMQCDEALNQVLISAESYRSSALTSKTKKTRSKHTPAFDVQKIACSLYGTDLFDIAAISYNTVLCLLTHISRKDFDRFPTVKHFTSWLRLAPDTKKTGGKVISSRTPKGKNAIALALRQAANSIGNMKGHALCSFFKRIAYKKGRGAAITATARKLAVIIYKMITTQQAYQPADTTVIELKQKQQRIKNLTSQLKKLNLNKNELEGLFVNTLLTVGS